MSLENKINNYKKICKTKIETQILFLLRSTHKNKVFVSSFFLIFFLSINPKTKKKEMFLLI